MIIGLLIIFILVLLLPFTKKVEHHLEVFLFLIGLVTAFISNVLTSSLWFKALGDPIKISLAVFFAGCFFKWLQFPIENSILRISKMMPFRLFIALIVILLGLISSIITAIIAALCLVAIVSGLRLDRSSEIKLVILACYAIGLGAALTPIGEPLATITISKLDANFFFLIHLIGFDIIIGVIMFGVMAALLIHPKTHSRPQQTQQVTESYSEITVRACKVYLFVMGLTLLGAGFEPVISRYLLDLSPYLLYWINMISAILDNATLAAAEVSPAMNETTLSAILLGLLISGGMLIPGNIPNIIAAGKLKITSKEWARIGIPIGLITMNAYFLVIVFR